MDALRRSIAAEKAEAAKSSAREAANRRRDAPPQQPARAIRCASKEGRMLARGAACREIAELAIERQAHTLLMPVSARRQLNDLPDELISIEFYKDTADAVFKALVE
jgi:hypothetical protein